MPKDYEQETTIKGFDGTVNRTIKVTIDGQLYTLLVGANNVIVAVDDDGNISSVMQGQHGGELRTLLVDNEGRISAQLMGMYGTTSVPVAVNAVGSLTLTSLAQSTIEPDPNESQTWDVSLGSLLNNLNRIRWMLVAITGETWGTVSRSLTTIWAKFHATTGHAHSGTANDGKPIHHGDTTGLTDDDHARYFDKDGSKAYASNIFRRNVNNDTLYISGATGVDGTGAVIALTGKDFTPHPGGHLFYVVNAAKTGLIGAFQVTGATDTPDLNMLSHQITHLLNPTQAQHAATKNYVDAVGKAWSAWTPTVTWYGNTPTGVSVSARWTRIGNTAFFEIKIYASNSKATAYLSFTLPVAHAGSAAPCMFSSYEGAGTGGNVAYNPFAFVDPNSQEVYFFNWIVPLNNQPVDVVVSGVYETS